MCDKYLRKGANLFFNMPNKVPIVVLVKVCMAFIVGTPVSELAMTLNMRDNTIKDIYKSLRHLVIEGYSPEMLGGFGSDVEMDEMYWIRRTRKFFEDREKQTDLLFGGIERSTGRIRLQLLTNREVIPTEEMVSELSMVFTDSYVGYSKLVGKGYDHYHLIKPSYVDKRPENPGERKYYSDYRQKSNQLSSKR